MFQTHKKIPNIKPGVMFNINLALTWQKMLKKNDHSTQEYKVKKIDESTKRVLENYLKQTKQLTVRP